MNSHQWRPEVSQFLTGCDCAGYNVRRFDRKLVEAEYKRVGVPCPLTGARWLIHSIISPSVKPAHRCDTVLLWRSRFHGHSPIDDVRATLLTGQLAKYLDLPATADGLDELCGQRDPSWIDPDGKIVFKDGHASVNIGKNAGRGLRDLATSDPGYLRWIIEKDFTHP